MHQLSTAAVACKCGELPTLGKTHYGWYLECGADGCKEGNPTTRLTKRIGEAVGDWNNSRFLRDDNAMARTG